MNQDDNKITDESTVVVEEDTGGDVAEHVQWDSSAAVPDVLPILPLRNTVALPGVITPFVIGREKTRKMIDDVTTGNRYVCLVAQRDTEIEDPAPENLYDVGAAAVIVKMLRFPDDTIRVLAQVLKRMKITGYVSNDPYLKASVEPMEDVAEGPTEIEALKRNMGENFQKMVQLHPQLPDEAQVVAMNIDDAGRFADFVASSLTLELPEKQALLEETDVRNRLTAVSQKLAKEVEILELSSKIKSDTTSRLEKSQREYFLRQQLETIRQELGETDETSREVEEIRKSLEEAGLPEEAMEQAERELDRLAKMHPSSAEYSVARTYLDWMTKVPWQKASEDKLDLGRAQKVLDRDHFGLDKVKERIVEYLSVRKLKQDMHGPILCFSGPPGTGKTSMGRSIAETLGREFVRISLGGVRDEAEIRGHRRTYVGALPGRIIQGLRNAGTKNPVFMLDEIDKLGNDFRGDPSSALLEVLDPEQNDSFEDHYLDVPFDLSQVMFITTANVLYSIPGPLRDRMEVLEFPGYTDREKLGIAREHLLPKQLEEHGLTARQVKVTDKAILGIVDNYTREAGVRNVERRLATVCRKAARKVVEGEKKKITVDAGDLRDYLGKERFFSEISGSSAVPGTVTGLAWTPYGGEILIVESSLMAGKKGFMLTGQLGDIMKESAHAALTFIRAHADDYGIPSKFFEENDIHIHVPSGAIPKDGPSAGTAMVSSIASLLTNKKVDPKLAMTGEITLNGRVLPVGGIKEKVLGAERAGIERVIVPKRNERDLDDVPEEIRDKMKFHPVESIPEVIDIALGLKTETASGATPKPKKKTTKTKKKKATKKKKSSRKTSTGKKTSKKKSTRKKKASTK